MSAESVTYDLVGGSARLVHTRPGLQSTAVADDQGQISLTANAPAPKNEDGTLEICARLVRKLNAVGGNWSEPREGQQDIDAYSTNARGGKLHMQVVRACINTEIWREVNKTGLAKVDNSASNVAFELIAAIRKKGGTYAPDQKKGLVLVLDAARTPSYTFQRVLDVFRELHLSECQKVGFAQIWLVGPQDSIIERLDR